MKVKFLNVSYEQSETIKHQGNRESIQPYLNQGYKIRGDRNGNWILAKPAKVMVTIGKESYKKTFDMKEAILNYYSRERISKKLIDKFIEDAKNEKIKFELDLENNSYNFY